MDKTKFIYFSSVKYDVLRFIKAFIKERKYSPTHKEIGMNFNYSRARAAVVVTDLYKMGFISKGYSAHRNIRMDQDQLNAVANIKYNKEYKINDW